jgi:CBS domain-containing protein
MRFLIDAAYEQLPTSQVGPFMNTDFGRVVTEDANLIDVASMFLEKYYRRLVVLQDGILQGQISRRDVLRAGQQLADVLRTRDHALLDHGDKIERSDEINSAPLQRPGSLDIKAFMDTRAQTVTEDMDLLGIAQIFLNTNYRRLPVLRDGRLVGQVSRRDVLQATYDVMAVVPQRESTLLYLSSLLDQSRAPIPR